MSAARILLRLFSLLLLLLIFEWIFVRLSWTAQESATGAAAAAAAAATGNVQRVAAPVANRNARGGGGGVAARFQRNRLRPNRNALNEDDGVLEGDEADEMDVDRRRRLLLAAANNALAEDGDDVLNNDDDDEMDEEAEAAEREELRKKLGTKKLAKLEEKAARRERNEQMLKEREERKAREDELYNERKRLEEEEERAEKEREEQERKLKEEQERKEHEEYLRLKAQFSVDEEGQDATLDESDAQNMLQLFVDFIKNAKVVVLEDLAGEFKLKTQVEEQLFIFQLKMNVCHLQTISTVNPGSMHRCYDLFFGHSTMVYSIISLEKVVICEHLLNIFKWKNILFIKRYFFQSP